MSTLLLSAAAASSAEGISVDIIRPENVKPGMRGYGLTVMRGTEPERFEIEVLGRLHNMMPRQDIILVKCLEESVVKTGVAQGMSGSPIYIVKDGKSLLMGALAYGWSFQTEPIAGITPIVNMMEGLKPVPQIAAPAAGPRDPQRIVAALRGQDEPEPGPAAAPGQLRPVTTPLMVSGVSAQLMGDLKRRLAPLGLEPVQGGSGGADDKKDVRPFRPGDAIGVQLMRGDSDWTAIGTVTHVEGKRVLAFGHPFLHAGPWQAPATRARVEWIMARSYTSFKLATPTGVIGRLVNDLQSCIAAELGPEPEMIPMAVSVTAPEREEARYSYEMIQHRQITGILAFYAAVDSINAAFPLRNDATLRIGTTVAVKDHGSVTIDMIEASGSSVSYSLSRPLEVLLGNPFEHVRIEKVDVKVDVQPGRRTAYIMSARCETPVVKAGATVALRVKLRPFGAEDTEIVVKLPVPKEFKGKKYPVKIVPAGSIAPPIAPPRNFGDYMSLLEKAFAYPETSLALVTPRLTRGVRTEGHVMSALPSSVINVLSPAGAPGPTPEGDLKHQLFETEWVLSGSAAVALDVIE
jgi:hypothetical protein